MLEQSTESSVAFDQASSSCVAIIHDRSIPNSLMWTFVVVVLDILRDQVFKVLSVNWDEVIEAFVLVI